MNFEKYRIYTTDDFVPDEAFIQWVLHPDPETNRQWFEFLEAFPDRREQVREAAFIVKALQPLEEPIHPEDLGRIYNNIQGKLRTGKKKQLYALMRAAVVLVLLTGTLSVFLLQKARHDRFPETASNPLNREHGMVILSDGSTVQFDTRETRISQTATGNILINNDTVRKATASHTSQASALTQVIIPYGKRSEVVLPDGSHVWLNSGSQLSYPSEFSGKTRDVYLAGEAFFDVEHDAGHPFQVITHEVRISVLGTRFNVSAYQEDPTIQTVLLSGKVAIRKNALLSRPEELVPGERMLFSRADQGLTKDRVDPQYITSWIYGYLIFEKEPTPGIFKKLERYYNQPIRAEKGLEEISFSGKLDLKENLNEVLENIAFASSLRISREGETYVISK